VKPPAASRRGACHAGDVTVDTALAHLDRTGIRYAVRKHPTSTSLAEHAAAIGVEPADLAKTLVVRRGEGDYLFVIVPGGRKIAWKKLRGALGVNRLTLPPAEEARQATGYERGTITPFGSTHDWPVWVDRTLLDPPDRQVSIGGGDHETSVVVSASDLLDALDATVADLTEPE